MTKKYSANSGVESLSRSSTRKISEGRKDGSFTVSKVQQGLSYNGRSVVEIRARHKAPRGREKAGQIHTARSQSLHAMGQPEERPALNNGYAQRPANAIRPPHKGAAHSLER